MKNLKIQRISCGYHYIMQGTLRIGTMERSEGGPVPAAGEWFATYHPSTADYMTNQWDRWRLAAAHGRTMNECLKEFARNY